ncbi:DEAD/DEAH box helicase [uncultured Ruminococcus sp.]|jgi:ATP-dependent DNA helicase RecQ|uniref:DEAD/DEAH box helicase n=1 Tax=Ruminococcus sp. TaxID=41978 RepID=UPI00259BD26A|nr:DEAD/DEAH box helicase [uncultured Ruminococcus sp.]
MTDHDIIHKVQDFFDNPNMRVNSTDLLNGDNVNTAVAERMINAYQRFMSNQTFEKQIEFECSLRNFLLFLKTSVTIKDYNLLTPNCFGLKVNYSNDSIYANFELPNYVNETFVRTIFDNQQVQKVADDTAIKVVNPYIYKLTKQKFMTFKSIEQQLAVIGALRVPAGYTAMVAMSTGGGKSLITQTVSYQYDNGLTIIIVPTISLMLDQQRNASSIIKPDNKKEIMYYHSGCNVDELISALDKNLVRMLFISPEALIKNIRIQDSILKANSKGYLKNLVIDEAHIIIEWGASFRVDFQCLDSFKRLLVKDNPSLRTYLLSATFSKKVVDNLKMFYGDDDRWIEIRLDALRKEPRFDIIKCNSYTEKHDRIKELVCKLPRPMIIYVNSPDDAEKVQHELAKVGFDNTRIFTGKTKSIDRERIINEWISDKFDLMIATCAFGVGVDKKDVRTVIHSYIPSSADQYYQECGRGGRDGLPCLSVMLYTDDDIKATMSMTQKVLTVEKLCGRWFSMLNNRKTNIRLDSIVIDTSVKPNYSDIDSFYVDVNNADITWNVYVILLLRRARMIEITDVKYSDDRYIFNIKLIDKRIRFDCEQTIEIFNGIRDDESKSIYMEIKELTSKLRRVGKSCWSSMFNDIYLLTEEYCAGCNNHNDIRSERGNHFPLKKPIFYPVSIPEGKLCNVMTGTKEMLIICEEDSYEIIQNLLIGADIIIIPDESELAFRLLNSKIIKPTQYCMGYSEFFDLSRMNSYYYLSGNIVFYIGDDQELAERVLNISHDKEYNRVYVVNSDFYIAKRNKNISELVNGACKYDYIIKKELI